MSKHNDTQATEEAMTDKTRKIYERWAAIRASRIAQGDAE